MCAGFPAGGVAHQLVNRTGGGRRLPRDRRPHAGRRGQLSARRHRRRARAGWQLDLHPQGRHALLDARLAATLSFVHASRRARHGRNRNPMPLVDPVHRFVLFTNAKCGGTTLKAWFFENLDFATLHRRPATLVGAFGPAYAAAHLRRGWRLARRAARAAPGSSDHKERLRAFVTFYRRAYCCRGDGRRSGGRLPPDLRDPAPGPAAGERLPRQVLYRRGPAPVHAGRAARDRPGRPEFPGLARLSRNGR